MLRRYRMERETMLEDDTGEWCRFEDTNRKQVIMNQTIETGIEGIEIGLEKFKTSYGDVYKRPVGDIGPGDTVGIVGIENTIEAVGIVTSIKVIGGEAFVMINVGGANAIPRRLNEIAIPL